MLINVNGILACLILGFVVGAISCSISKAGIMRPIRQSVGGKNEWFGKLISCAYCTSHWVAAIFVVIYRPTPIVLFQPVDLVVAIFLIVALASWIVFFIDWSVGFKEDPLIIPPQDNVGFKRKERNENQP